MYGNLGIVTSKTRKIWGLHCICSFLRSHLLPSYYGFSVSPALSKLHSESSSPCLPSRYMPWCNVGPHNGGGKPLQMYFKTPAQNYTCLPRSFMRLSLPIHKLPETVHQPLLKDSQYPHFRRNLVQKQWSTRSQYLWRWTTPRRHCQKGLKKPSVGLFPSPCSWWPVEQCS